MDRKTPEIGPINILVVDDEEVDINFVRGVLERDRRFTVFSAGNFDEAVREFELRQPIDLALLDVALPGRNGVDLAKHLLGLQPDLRILFVSGHVGASVIRFYGMNAGDEHFLQKPFTAVTLLERVEQALVSSKRLEAIFAAGSSSAFDEA